MLMEPLQHNSEVYSPKPNVKLTLLYQSKESQDVRGLGDGREQLRDVEFNIEPHLMKILGCELLHKIRLHDLPTRAGAMALWLSRIALLRCIEASGIQRSLLKALCLELMKS